MEKWHKANPSNVVLVHCKGGKGRSGSVVSRVQKEDKEGKRRGREGMERSMNEFDNKKDMCISAVLRSVYVS